MRRFAAICAFWSLFATSCKSWGKFWETGAVTLTGFNGRSVGELWSNTLLGTSSGSVARVEVSLAGGGWTTVTGTSSWRYSIPLSANLKVGKKYTFSARAVGSDGAVLDTQSVELIRRQNHDLNGDGYPDAVVSAISYASNTGRVYIQYGGTTIVSGSAAGAKSILTAGGTSQKFGITLGMGDVNGDGYGDLVVGGEDYNSSQGGMWIFYGSAAGIPTQVLAATPPHVGVAVGDYFGGALALGDANGDGYQDVVVSSRERSGSIGEIYLYLGSAAGLAGTSVASKNGISSDRLGTSVAFLDTNNDGYADIVAGAPTTGTGSVSIFAGTPGGFNTTAMATIMGETTSDRFGENVSLGDFNNDGYADLIVGATQRNAGAATQGVAYLLPGSASGFGSFTVSTAGNIVIAGEAGGNQFPRSVLVADVNGDGLMDIIAASHLANSTGTVYIFNGKTTPYTSMSATASTRKIYGITASDGFGVSLGIKDFNLDGYPDVFTGAYQRDAGAGANQGTGSVFFGQAAGAATQTAATANATITGETITNAFGYTAH